MIHIKPHHFIDIITQLGDAEVSFEPHPYGHDVHRVARQIQEDPDVLLVIELGIDAICEPCCHNVNGVCDDSIDISFRPQAPASKQAYNLLIDRRWCERLQLQRGDRLTARQFCLRLQEHADDLNDIYCETPAARTETRQRRLNVGIARFLSASERDP